MPHVYRHDGMRKLSNGGSLQALADLLPQSSLHHSRISVHTLCPDRTFCIWKAGGFPSYLMPPEPRTPNITSHPLFLGFTAFTGRCSPTLVAVCRLLSAPKGCNFKAINSQHKLSIKVTGYGRICWDGIREPPQLEIFQTHFYSSWHLSLDVTNEKKGQRWPLFMAFWLHDWKSIHLLSLITQKEGKVVQSD